VVGNLESVDGLPTEGLSGSYPVLLAQSGFGTPNANFATTEFIEQYNLQYGLNVAWMCYSMSPSSSCDASSYDNQSMSHYQTAVIVFSTNQSNAGSGSNQSFGTQQLAFAPIPGTTLGQQPTSTVDTVNNYLDNPTPNDPTGYNGILINPPGGISVCVADSTTNESGLLTIGGNNRAAQISMTIHDGSTDCS
jgi:hypothetical protein